jgi:sugar (pentulose or hexulose) kinase
MERNILVGIDMGTNSVRVGFYNNEGNSLGFKTKTYETYQPHYAWVEQNPIDWILALREALSEGLKENDIKAEQILGLSTGTTCCSVVLCKRDGSLLRNCILWMDVRASKEAEEITELTGEHLSAEWMPCKLLWLKRNEPENYNNAEVFCECQDWVTFWLTGLWSININTACNWGYNSDEGGFPNWFYEKISLSDAMDKFPTDHCYAVGDKIGYLTNESAAYLGLPPDTLVAQGGIDSSIGILGMGVCEKGKVALMTGSSNLAMLLTDKMMFSDSTINVGPNHLIHGYYTSFRGQVSSNSIIEWYKKEFCKDVPEDGFYKEMEGQAEKIPVGSEGLLVLDYWQGNRHPYFDTKVRGLIYGMSLGHTRAHVYRGIMEGIAYGTQNLFQQFEDAGFDIKEINISGGTTNSDLFLQIQADISNININVPMDCQSVCMGAAICVAKACGIYDSLEDAVKHMVRYQKVIKPNTENHIRYQKLFQQYQKLYPLLKEWMHDTTDICLK